MSNRRLLAPLAVNQLKVGRTFTRLHVKNDTVTHAVTIREKKKKHGSSCIIDRLLPNINTQSLEILCLF